MGCAVSWCLWAAAPVRRGSVALLLLPAFQRGVAGARFLRRARLHLGRPGAEPEQPRQRQAAAPLGLGRADLGCTLIRQAQRPRRARAWGGASSAGDAWGGVCSPPPVSALVPQPLLAWFFAVGSTGRLLLGRGRDTQKGRACST
jgi:hypothetical protein